MPLKKKENFVIQPKYGVFYNTKFLKIINDVFYLAKYCMKSTSEPEFM